jgi:predicted branched-subunit amino acid permease
MTDEAVRGSEGYVAGVRVGLPLALVIFVVAVSFGALARSLGWGVLAPIVFSVTAFSVTAQFAVAAVMGAGGGVFLAIAAAVLLNARFLPMGMAVGPSLSGGRLRRALESQTIISTSWALAFRGGGRFDGPFMIGATIPQYLAWVTGTVVGVLTEAVGAEAAEKLGLDAVFPAFFLALLITVFRGGEKRTITAIALAAAIAVALVPIAPPGVPMLAACAAALLGLKGGSS